jgi:hypothetical protein
MQAKLNLFQRTMLRWRELHPYSAAHAVRVAKPLEEARLRYLISRRLEAHGLTGLVLDPGRGSLHREGGAANTDLRVLTPSDDPVAALWSELEAQLNTPFATAGRIDPFRFFAIGCGDGFYLGLVYDHFIAGGDAIALLLKDIVDDYATGGAAPRPDRPLQLVPAGYWRLLLHHPFSALWAVLRVPGLVASTRRAARPPMRPDQASYDALCHLRLSPRHVAGLHRAAAEWGVTLNDLLLASLLQALAPLAPERSRARRRRELAVASIVNIRHDLPPDAVDALGPFLASFQVAHPVPPEIGLRELAQDVHAMSGRIRRQRLYLQFTVALGVASLMWPLLSPARRLRFFPKYHPVWGGVSMLNVNTLWGRAASGGAPPAEYSRAISTGPACPLVLAVTAAQDVIQVGISFRTAVFSRAMVDGVKVAFGGAIEALAEERHR